MILNTQTALKHSSALLRILCVLFISQTLAAANGLLFNVQATGASAQVSIILCLNGNGPLSCQNYTVSALNLKISTTRPNHIYSSIGIKSNTPGYAFSGCTLNANGYCIFSASNTKPANITLYQPSHIISASVASLALSVNCPSATVGCIYTNTALTGNSRQITLTNNSPISATNVSVSASGFPTGTTITSSTCGTILESNESCIIHITPGKTASSNCTTGSSPANGLITVRANNTIATQINVLVLSYGCIYQGGYVYAIDDTTPNTQSISGKVATQFDQIHPIPGIIWSSNSSGTYDGGVSIWGIDETSTPNLPSPNASSFDPATKYSQQSNCNGAIDGFCNTKNIYIYYSTVATPAPPLSMYAAGLCKQPISGYSDWYLPAICEMGNDEVTMVCTSPPLIQLEQNMEDNLPMLVNNCIGAKCLAGNYWSSTELSGNPPDIAWSQCFATNGNSIQCVEGKDDPLGVRCSREF